jgi:hypothetical protein
MFPVDWARFLVTAAGGLLVIWGLRLMLDYRGAADWWVDYTERQREIFGRFWGPRYTKRGARQLGLFTVAFGLVFVAVGIWS